MQDIREITSPKTHTAHFENSWGSATDDILYAIGSVWVDSNRNRNVLYAYENSAKRNLNLNWDDNEWNENCRFPAVRNSLLGTEAPALTGRSFSNGGLSLPAAEHFPDFDKRRGNRQIRFVVHHF